MDEDYTDFGIPFDGMTEDEFLFRTMNESAPMYMGPEDEPNPADFDD